jgi:hypothetical protein
MFTFPATVGDVVAVDVGVLEACAEAAAVAAGFRDAELGEVAA